MLMLTLRAWRHVVTTGTGVLTAAVVWHSQELPAQEFPVLGTCLPITCSAGKGAAGAGACDGSQMAWQRGMEASQRAALGTGCLLGTLRIPPSSEGGHRLPRIT